MNRRGLFFALAVISQALILAAVPAHKVYTRASGKRVILKIRPVDPYSVLSGYYVTLGYEIGDIPRFNPSATPQIGETVFAIVEKGADGIWQPVSLSKVHPDNLPENRLAIRGKHTYRGIEYGIEEFFIPEEERAEINQGLRDRIAEARVEIKVDSRGNAALVRLLIGDRVYED